MTLPRCFVEYSRAEKEALVFKSTYLARQNQKTHKTKHLTITVKYNVNTGPINLVSGVFVKCSKSTLTGALFKKHLVS